jgi:hypothetical protein
VRTKSKQQKAADKRAHLDAMEKVLKEEHVAIGVFDQKAQKLMKDTMEAHSKANTCVAACAKLQANLKRRVSDVSR